MKTLKLNPLYLLALLITLLSSFLILGSLSYADETDTRATETDRYETFTFFSATTTNATSTADGTGNIGMDIKGAKGLTFYFSRAFDGGNAGTSTFNVEISPDEGVTWIGYNKLISNVTNTNAQMPTRVASVAIVAATSTTMAAMDLQTDAFSRVRCVVVEGTDGAHTCKASVRY